MISYIPFELTRKLFIIISLYFLLVVILFWRKKVNSFDYYSGPGRLLTLLFFFHLVFAFDGGDFFHYYEYFVNKDFEAMESIYSALARFVGYNYIWFRIIVWGGALLLFQQTAKRFGIDVSKATYVLYVMFIGVFDYARVSLAMAIYFYGLSFICVPIKRNTILSYILAIFLVFSSTFFHRSMVFTAAMTIMAFLPLNPYLLVILLVAFSLSSPLLKDIFYNYIMSGELIPVGDLQNKILSYSDLTFINTFSVFEWVRRVLVYSSFILPVIYLAFKLFKNADVNQQHSGVFKLYKVTVGLLLLAISILMISSDAFVIFYRYLFMLMIPVVLLVSYSRQNGLLTHRMFVFLLILCLTHELFGMAKLILGGNLL